MLIKNRQEETNVIVALNTAWFTQLDQRSFVHEFSARVIDEEDSWIGSGFFLLLFSLLVRRISFEVAENSWFSSWYPLL